MADQDGGFETSGLGGGFAETECPRCIASLVGGDGRFNVGFRLNG